MFAKFDRVLPEDFDPIDLEHDKAAKAVGCIASLEVIHDGHVYRCGCGWGNNLSPIPDGERHARKQWLSHVMDKGANIDLELA